MESKALVTVGELAKILNVPKSWVYGRTRQGRSAIPHIKLGLYLRFDAEEVINFVGGHENGTKKDNGGTCAGFFGF